MFAVFSMRPGPKAGVKSRIGKYEERCAALVGDQNRDEEHDRVFACHFGRLLPRRVRAIVT
jgi:hypothetical protein